MTRPGEVRFARWDEFDMERAEWRIPAVRMKIRLSHQALAVLDELCQLTGHCELLFPSERSLTKPISENTLSYAMGRMGYAGIATPHGFRALASTTLSEEGFYPDMIERQLAHAKRNKVRGPTTAPSNWMSAASCRSSWQISMNPNRAATCVR